MKKKLLFISVFISSMLFSGLIKAQIYHEDDKEGLRVFLRQPINSSIIGLTPSDTLSWYESEEWVEKISTLTTIGYCLWNEDTPKRLKDLDLFAPGALFHGILDCTPFEKLESLQCANNYLEDIILTGNLELQSLNCAGNRLTAIDLTHNTKLRSVDISRNNLQELILTNKMYLTTLYCNSNNLKTLDLSNNPNLHILNIAVNYLKFSTLPLNYIYPDCIYSSQKWIRGDTVPANEIIDLSSEYEFNGNITRYEWRSVAGGPALSFYDLGGGKFIAGAQYVGRDLVCSMTNDVFPGLTIYYQVAFTEAVSEQLTDHLTLVESPQTDYYVASSGQTFKVKANASVDPALVKIGLFKTTGSFVEEISFERENDIYTCHISNAAASGSYMIQAYTNMGGNITALKRPENSHLVDILPFAFTKTNSNYNSNQVIASHLVLNTAEKNLYKAYIDETFRVVVNVPTTAETRIGLFDLYGELVEDITQSVSGKIFTCMVSYNVFPDNYVIMPYTDTPLGSEIIERSPGAAIMDRLPIAVDYNWGFRSVELLSQPVENRNDETGISLLDPVSVSLAQDILYVNAQEEVKTIEIFDINGRLVKKAQSVANISVADLSAGIYIAKINTPSETVTCKIRKN